MLIFGVHPILECSSKGDKRFSAFYARVKFRHNRTIEEMYQGFKLFPGHISGLSIKEAKGKSPVNMESCKRFYCRMIIITLGKPYLEVSFRLEYDKKCVV